MGFRNAISYLAAALLVGSACSARRATPLVGEPELKLSSREVIYRGLAERNLDSARFVSGDWMYHVELFPGNPTEGKKIYIKGVKYTGSRDLDAVFTGKMEKKDADLMIYACGQVFGDDDSCDYYSPSNEPVRTGEGITQEDLNIYNSILNAAATTLKR